MKTSSLTEDFAKKVSVEERTDFRDPDVHGLMLRVTPAGVKTWALWYRDPEGAAHTLTLGRYPILSAAMAKDKAKRELLIRQMGIGSLVRQEEPEVETGPKVTTGALLRKYLEEYSKKHKRTWRFDDELIRGPLAELAHYPARELSRGEVRRWFETHSAVAPVHANRALALLRRVFNWALDEKLVAENPAARHPMNRERARWRVLKEEEIRSLWEAIDQDGTSAAESLRFMLLTAQRRGEVLRMRFEDVSLKDGTTFWEIPETETKNGVPQRVPLLEEAKRVLAKQFDRSLERVYVFETDRKSATPYLRSPMKAVSRLKKKTGVTGWTPHDLRRTAATYISALIADQSASREVLRAVLNHVDPTVTGRYDKYRYDAQKIRVFRAWEKKLLSLVQTKKGPASSREAGPRG